jgi:hypothetical protein
MNYLNNDRSIDDAGLNQDSTFDKKDEEDFENSDDFHKYDHTDKDTVHAVEQPEKKVKTRPVLNKDKNALNTNGQFDGNIAV